MTAARVLICAQAAPDLSTAYARVGRELAINLARLRPVELIGVHGNPASRYTLSDDGATVPVHPYPWSYFHVPHIHGLAQQLGAAAVVFVGDAWPFAGALAAGAEAMPWLLMAPVDHVPLVPAEQLLSQTVAGWASPTKWGAAAVSDAGGVSGYVPHGVSDGLFSDIEGADREARRAAACKRMGWDASITRYLAVGGNVGDRKNLSGILRAWADADLQGRSHDCELVLWCYPTRDQANPDGYDLIGAAMELGIDNVRFPAPYEVSVGSPDSHLGVVYTACDVLIQASKTEGFGLPIIEAAAAGIPAMVTRYAPFLEVAGIDADDPLTLPIGTWELMQLLGTAWMPCPSHDGLVDALRWFGERGVAYSRTPAMRRRIEHAQGYTWEFAAAALNGMIATALKEDDNPPA